MGVHLVAGLWGTIAIGFFATGTFGTAPGLFYGGDGWKLLVVQIVIALVALVFTAIMTTVCFYVLKPLGWRIDEADESAGIDGAEHAETAYESQTQSLRG